MLKTMVSSSPMSQRLETNLGALIDRLEIMHDGLGGHEKQREHKEEADEFTILKKLVVKQIQQVRTLIQERDDLLQVSGGSGGKKIVQLSANIRELLRQAKETHKKLQSQLAKEEKGPAQGKDDIEAHIQIVELVSKHIVECEDLQKKRYQRGFEGRTGAVFGTEGRAGGAQVGKITRTIEATERIGDIDPEIEEGLQHLMQNDQQLDQQLDLISQRLIPIKAIAMDQSNAIKLQSVIIDHINDNMDKASGHLNHVNSNLKGRLEQAGGALSVITKIILLVILLGLTVYLYKKLA